MKNSLHSIRYILLLLLLTATGAMAQVLPQNTTSGLPRAEQNNTYLKAENIATKPFTFGIEAGACMDFSGTDSSCFDIDIYGGYRNGIIRLLGLGIGVHPSFAHNRTFIPFYALFRCNFTEGRSLCFADVKAGLSINELSSDTHFTGAYASAGIGFNLLQTKLLSTYIIASYNYSQITPFDNFDTHALHGVSIRLGVTF